MTTLPTLPTSAELQNKTEHRCLVCVQPSEIYSRGSGCKNWQEGWEGPSAPYWLRRRFFLLPVPKLSRLRFRGCEDRAGGFSPEDASSAPR